MKRLKHLVKLFFGFITKDKKHKIIFTISVLILILGGYYVISNNKGGVQVRETTAKVELGNIEKTIKVVGSAELVDEQQLRFNQQGEVIAVYFKEGDSVEKGDIIAKLDSESAENSIKQTQISLENSQIELQEVLDGSTNLELMQAQNSVDTVQNNFLISQEEYNKLLVEQATTLKEKEEDLVLAKVEINMESQGTGSIVLSKTLTDTINSIRQYITDAEDVLNAVDVLFGISDENKDKNNEFELYLSAKDPGLKSKIKPLRKILSTKQKNISEEYYALKSNDINQENLLALLGDMSEMYEQMIDLGDYAVSATSMSIESVSYTDNQIQNDKSSMTQMRGQSQNAFTQIENIIDSVNNSDISFQKTINSYESLKADLDQLKKDYEIKIKSKENEIKNLQMNLEINKEKLEEIKKGATERQVLLAQNNVVKAKISLDSAKKTLENYQIEAPFDGVLRKIDFKVGDKLTSDENKYVYLENPNLVKMTALLDQIDIVSVKEGQDVRVVFDAYENITVTGIVSEIDSTAQTNSNVVSYKISVAIDKGELAIYGGMTAKMYIVIEGKNNLLLVPSSYIQQRGNKNIVLVKTQTGDARPQEVEIGITDDIQTEIVSGLQEGDVVIKQISLGSNEKITTQSSFGLLGGGGGGGMGGGTRPSGGPGM